MIDKDTAKDREVLELKEWYGRDYEADRVNREEALEDLQFRIGEQWNELDRLEREAEGRPIVTINNSGKFINQVVGDLRKSRPSIIVKPDGFGADEDKAKIINGILRNIQRRAITKEPYLNAVDGAAVCGQGHFRIITEYLPDNPFDQEISIIPVMNHLGVVWDADSLMPDRSDAKRCWVMSSMDRKAFEEAHPDYTPQPWDSHDDLAHYWYPSRDVVIIAEVFTIEMEETTFVRTQEGRILDLGNLSPMLEYNEDHQVIQDIVGNVYPIEQTKKSKVRRCKWKKMTGTDVIERGQWVTGDIPIVPVLGPETIFEKHKYRESLIRWFKDPARLYNYWRTVQTETVANMPRAPYLIGDSQIKGHEDEWANMNSGNDPYFAYNDDNPTIPPPQRQAPPMPPSAFQNEIMQASEDMKNTTGIYDAALGARSNETSGIAIRRRQAESDVATSHYGSRLEGSLNRAGKIIVDAIPLVYDVNRAMKIVHEDDTDEEVEINQVVVEDGIYKIYNDITQGRYDVQTDIGPSYASQQEQGLEMLQGLIGNDPEMIRALSDILIKMANVPHSEELIKRVRKMLPPGMTDGEDQDNDQITPLQQQQQRAMDRLAKLDMAIREAEAKKTAAEADEADAKAKKATAEAENETVDTLIKKMEASTLAGTLPPGATELMKVFLKTPVDNMTPNEPVAASAPPPANPLTAPAIPQPAI